jgi:membrane associated rhomboid family serine protease
MLPIGDQDLPGQGFAWVTAALIAANVAVFVLLLGAGVETQATAAFTYGYSAIPFEITHGVDLVSPVSTAAGVVPQAPGPSPIYLTLLTSIFMHGGWAHIGGNMLFLWIFGDNVEHRIGSVRFLIFYLVAGVIASLAQIAIGPDSKIPTLGASGAISGVLGAYIVLYPMNRVLVWIWGIFSIPALAVIGIWIVLQFVNGVGSFAISQESGGVAYFAHVGGFIVGVLAGFAIRATIPEPAVASRYSSRWR